jgi:peptide/nickel transport system substrate-binding protein
MKKSNIYLLFVAVLLLAAVVVVPIFAQTGESDFVPDVGPGEGAPIIGVYFGGDPATTNPILVQDGTSGDVVSYLFPPLIGTDPETGLPMQNHPRALAQTWEISEDGTVFTFQLRQDRVWSDGTAVTANDIVYAYDAIMSGEVDTSLISSFDGIVSSVVALDDYTLEVTFAQANCDATFVAQTLPVVPSHYYQTIYPTYADMTYDNENNLNPEVTSGPFSFGNFRAGEQVTLLADQNYVGSPAGYVVPEGLILKSVADAIVGIEQFLAGDVNWIDSVPEDRQAEMQAGGQAGDFHYVEYPASNQQVLIFNLADPANPLDGRDADGNIVEQPPHPVLGDARVRQAIAYAMNYDEMNTLAFSGLGIPVGGLMLPQSWAYNPELQPYPHDLAMAMQLLDEAGFVDDDGDEATPRVATEDALYAEAGTALSFTFTTYGGNPSIDAFNQLFEEQIEAAGFDVTTDVVEFQVLVENLLGQTYDLIVVFFGPDPRTPNDMYDLFSANADAVGGGFNTGSFYNAEFEELMDEARALPGCDVDARRALYDRAQEILYTELPWISVNTSMVPIVLTGELQNFEPRRLSYTWNLSAWTITPAGE